MESTVTSGLDTRRSVATTPAMGLGTPLPRNDAAAVHERLHALARRAEEAAQRHDFVQARDLFETAYVLGIAAGATEDAAASLAGLGYVAHLSCDVLTAEGLYRRALETMTNDTTRAVITTRLAFAHYDRGELDAADEAFATVVTTAPSEEVRARAIGFRGNVARARGEGERALVLYEGAFQVATNAGDLRYAHTFAMDRALVKLLAPRGQHMREGLVELEELARAPFVATDAQLSLLVTHYRILTRIQLGLPVVEDAPDPHELARYLARARQTVAEPSRDALIELAESAPLNAHARATLHLVNAVRRPDAGVGARALVVARSGAFFRLADGEMISLAQRLPLARLLVALARARITRPGMPIEGEHLVEHAWPNERILPAARKNRLHVAIATLRKLGLRAVLASSTAGYWIDRDVTVVIVD